MNISLTDAKAHLTDLVRRAEAGEEIVLTRRGVPVARLTPTAPAKRDKGDLLTFLERISKEGAAIARPGPCAARSQDFLYDEDGLPKIFLVG